MIAKAGKSGKGLRVLPDPVPGEAVSAVSQSPTAPLKIRLPLAMRLRLWWLSRKNRRGTERVSEVFIAVGRGADQGTLVVCVKSNMGDAKYVGIPASWVRSIHQPALDGLAYFLNIALADWKKMQERGEKA